MTTDRQDAIADILHLFRNEDRVDSDVTRECVEDIEALFTEPGDPVAETGWIDRLDWDHAQRRKAEGLGADIVVTLDKRYDDDVPVWIGTAPPAVREREALERLLRVNGEAGSVEVNPDGSACFQYFVAQAGPFDEGTPVVVLGPKEIDVILSEGGEG